MPGDGALAGKRWLPTIVRMESLSRIAIDPEIGFGKPCVRGTRITVGDVLSYLASGMSEGPDLADFPQLTRDDIWACLASADRGSESRAEHPRLRGRLRKADNLIADLDLLIVATASATTTGADAEAASESTVGANDDVPF
jgi:uncharacterized protein (DUF433 family)